MLFYLTASLLATNIMPLDVIDQNTRKQEPKGSTAFHVAHKRYSVSPNTPLSPGPNKHCSARFTTLLTARPTSRKCCTLTCITSKSGAQLTHRTGRQQATVCFTVRPSSRNNSAPAGWILIKFSI